MTVWVRFSTGDGVGFGVTDGSIITQYRGDMFDDPEPLGARFAVEQVTLLTPVTPSKMIAMANNFHPLIEKLGLTVPRDPLYYLKSPSSFHPHNAPILRPAGYDGKIVFEGEVGIVIGRTCARAAPADIDRHIFGYTCVNDVTAIDILNKDPGFAQWTRCKGADTFGVFGPAIATHLDRDAIRVTTRVDGVVRQDYPLTDMVFSVNELVSRLSFDMTLYPGDVIACGTSVGIGSLKPGNIVEISIDGVGALRNEFAG